MTVRKRPPNKDEATPLLDALETLWRGPQDADYDSAWICIYSTLEQKKRRVLWSFPQEVQDSAVGGAMTRLLKPRRSFEVRIEAAAHSFVNRSLRWAALDLLPHPPRPKPTKQPQPHKPQRCVLDDVTAEPGDVALLFDIVVPRVINRWATSEFNEARKSSVKAATLAQKLDELRRLAIGQMRVDPTQRRAAVRKSYQRTIAILRALVPEIWEELKWCTPGVFPTRRPKPPTLESLWSLATANSRDLKPDLERTLRAIIELSRGFHVR